MHTLCSLLSAPSPPDAPIARRKGHLLYAASFQQRALCWCAAFIELPGTRIALYFEDSVDFAAALFGAWYAGKTAVLLGELTPAVLQSLATQVHALACDQSQTETLLPQVRPAALPAKQPTQSLDAERYQLEIFTSGSTGAPLSIPKKLRQLFAEVDTLEAAFGAQVGRSEVVGLVSHQHIYGLLFRVLWPLATGRVLHAERLPYVETLLQQLNQGLRATVVASPAHLKRLPLQQLQHPDRVALLFSSGGLLPGEALPECWRVFQQTPVEVYGSSETGGVAWRQRQHERPDAPVEWCVLPGITWHAAEDGLLQLRSSHLPDPGAWHDGADRVHVTRKGFELLGRVDHVLKVEGKRVSRLAMEQALLQTGLLAEVRVLLLSQDEREQLAVVAQPSPAGWAVLEEEGKPAFVAKLREYLAPHVDRIAIPRRWRFLSQLPCNAQGKSSWAALRAQFDPHRPPLRVLRREPDQVLLRLQIEADLPQLEGHFPGHPILSGVAQLDWVLLFAQELLGLTASFKGVDGLKFQQVIRPGMAVELQLSYLAPQLSFVYRSALGQHASGKILYGVGG